MRWAAWIGAGALLVAGCGGGKERLTTSGWRGVMSQDAGITKDATAANDATTAKDAVAAKDAGPARDGAGPPASKDGGSDAATDAGKLSPLGVPCARGADCASGFCADGVCCNTSCSGVCVSCATAGRVGTCEPVDVGAPEPHGLCVDQGARSCGQNGTCDGLGACAFYLAGTACAPSTCTGTTFTTEATCDGFGACGNAKMFQCTPYRCSPGGTSCTTACATADDCASGYSCNNDSCGLVRDGACSTDAECESGHCAQGVCCASACAAPCSSCALPGTIGTCEPDPSADPSTCG